MLENIKIFSNHSAIFRESALNTYSQPLNIDYYYEPKGLMTLLVNKNLIKEVSETVISNKPHIH